MHLHAGTGLLPGRPRVQAATLLKLLPQPRQHGAAPGPAFGSEAPCGCGRTLWRPPTLAPLCGGQQHPQDVLHGALPSGGPLPGLLAAAGLPATPRAAGALLGLLQQFVDGGGHLAAARCWLVLGYQPSHLPVLLEGPSAGAHELGTQELEAGGLWEGVLGHPPALWRARGLPGLGLTLANEEQQAAEDGVQGWVAHGPAKLLLQLGDAQSLLMAPCRAGFGAVGRNRHHRPALICPR